MRANLLEVSLVDRESPEQVTLSLLIVKGGDNAYVYTDAPFTGLQAPVNNGGNTPAISHVEVCYSDAESTTSS